MKKQKLRTLIFMILISAFLCTTIFSFARYISNSVTDYYLKSKGFYFYSDYLSTSSVNNMNNSWTGGSVEFSIRNSLNEDVATDYDINYTASCSIEGEASTHAICHMNGTSQESYTGTLTAIKSCQNNTGDNVDVSEFTKSECEIGGYRYISETIKTDLYFDIVLTDMEYTLTDVKVNVTVTSNTPYKKTLLGSFNLHKVEDNTVFSKSEDYFDYNRLSFYNTANVSKCVQVVFDTNKFLLDNKSSELPEYLEDEAGYITDFKQSIEPNSNLSFNFYKKSFGTSYNINDFYINTNCEIELIFYLVVDPTILEVYKGSNYDLMSGVTFTDEEGTPVSSTITYESSPTFDINTVGTYEVTYRTTYRNTEYTRNRTIEVIYEGVNIGFDQSDVYLVKGTSYNLMTGAALKDKDGNIISTDITYESNPTFDINTVGIYTVTYHGSYRGANYTNTRTVKVFESTYTYTSTIDNSFIAPAPGVYKIELWGAQGGNGGQGLCSGGLGGSGGKGGYVSATVTMSVGQTFSVKVGAKGTNGAQTANYGRGGYIDGSNGLGTGGVSGAGGGGGGSTTLNYNSTVYLRANGGGGGGGGADGGYYKNSKGAYSCGGCAYRNVGYAGGKGGGGGIGILGGNGAPNSCAAAGYAGGVGTYYLDTSYMTLITNTNGNRTGNGQAIITYLNP